MYPTLEIAVGQENVDKMASRRVAAFRVSPDRPKPAGRNRGCLSASSRRSNGGAIRAVAWDAIRHFPESAQVKKNRIHRVLNGGGPAAIHSKPGRAKNLSGLKNFDLRVIMTGGRFSLVWTLMNNAASVASAGAARPEGSKP